MPLQKTPDYYPVGILYPGGHSENRAMPHWCWVSDLCPFGSIKPATSWIADSIGYRYAFNGKENDPTGMGGGGSTYDYGFRIYNAQIARFLSVDPLFKSFPWNSVYSFAENVPIVFIDLDGLESVYPQPEGSSNNKVLVTDASYIKRNYMVIHGNVIPHEEYIKKLYVSHSFNSNITKVEWDQSISPSSRISFLIKHPINCYNINNISTTISGYTGNENAVLNTFSNFINDKLGIHDASDRKFTMTDGYGKVFRHITWQAILTIKFGYDIAKDAGDMQEYNYLMENGTFSQLEMSYRDLINNEYGRQLGMSFKSDLKEMKSLVNLLNTISEQVINSFPELMNAIPDDQRKPFTENSPGVKDLHNAIND